MVIIILICNHQVVAFLTFSFYFFLHSLYFLISLDDYTHPSLSRGLHEGYLVVLGSVPHLGVKIALVTHQDHRHVMSSLLTATTMRVKQTEVSSSLSNPASFSCSFSRSEIILIIHISFTFHSFCLDLDYILYYVFLLVPILTSWKSTTNYYIQTFDYSRDCRLS